MKWIRSFDLFLFDFDGLLVNTEELHFEAYRTLCSRRGYQLPWNLDQYFSIAHRSAGGIRESIYSLFPALQMTNWDALYSEKKQIYMDLLKNGKLTLLPGVENLLKELATQGVKRCVVTNSAKEHVEYIRHTLPALRSIPVWITREQYQNPKPAPDGYLKAIELLADPGDRVVGFEDTVRGVESLKGTHAVPVLICSKTHPQLGDDSVRGIKHFTTIEEIPVGTRF